MILGLKFKIINLKNPFNWGKNECIRISDWLKTLDIKKSYIMFIKIVIKK